VLIGSGGSSGVGRGGGKVNCGALAGSTLLLKRVAGSRHTEASHHQRSSSSGAQQRSEEAPGKVPTRFQMEADEGIAEVERTLAGDTFVGTSLGVVLREINRAYAEAGRRAHDEPSPWRPLASDAVGMAGRDGVTAERYDDDLALADPHLNMKALGELHLRSGNCDTCTRVLSAPGAVRAELIDERVGICWACPQRASYLGPACGMRVGLTAPLQPFQLQPYSSALRLPRAVDAEVAAMVASQHLREVTAEEALFVSPMLPIIKASDVVKAQETLAAGGTPLELPGVPNSLDNLERVERALHAAGLPPMRARLCVDCSAQQPQGSINDNATEATFAMQDGRVLLQHLREGDFAACADARRAFSQMRLSLNKGQGGGDRDAAAGEDYSASQLFCFKWRDRYWQSLVSPFGFRASPFSFSALGSVLQAQMRAEGIRVVFYLDDFCVLGESEVECQRSLTRMKEIFAAVGLRLSEEKETIPSQTFVFLAVQYTTVGSPRAELTEERRRRLKARVEALLAGSAVAATEEASDEAGADGAIAWALAEEARSEAASSVAGNEDDVGEAHGTQASHLRQRGRAPWHGRTRARATCRKDLESVAGVLSWAAEVMPGSRAWMASLWPLVNVTTRHVRLTAAARTDLRWWAQRLEKNDWRRCTLWLPWSSLPAVHAVKFALSSSDSSGTLGYGGIFDGVEYQGLWPSADVRAHSIGMLELLPQLVALTHLGERVRGKTVVVRIDNLGDATSLNAGRFNGGAEPPAPAADEAAGVEGVVCGGGGEAGRRGGGRPCNRVCKKLSQLALKLDVALVAIWRPRARNVHSDLLSRVHEGLDITTHDVVVDGELVGETQGAGAGGPNCGCETHAHITTACTRFSLRRIDGAALGTTVFRYTR
jgi:hypothetical protein